MPELVASRIMPRTTLNLDATVLGELRRRSEREGKPLGDLVSELLAQALREDAEQPARPLAFHTQAMTARVDLEDREAVQQLLDRGS
jgi:hypothetical protein